MIEQFKSARKVGCPLIAISTPDPSSTIEAIAREYADQQVFCWDVISGIAAANDAAKAFAQRFNPQSNGEDSTNPTEALIKAQDLPEGSILIVCNAHFWLDNNTWTQAAWNLRNPYKSTMRTLVFLAPSFTLPSVLSFDVLLLDEPLPTDDQLRKIIVDTVASAGAELQEEVIAKSVDAIAGLASFPSEQAVAMSLRRNKETKEIYIDLSALWDRKRKTIESTPGLSVWRGGETFDAIGGYSNLKNFLRRIVGGKRRPRCIVFLDEIEKLFAGATSGNDSSGVSQDFLGALLSYMEDQQASGIILIGPPGSGKSNFAKALGNAAGCPTICFDLGGMKASLVGESEARMRNALKVVTAVGQGQVFVIATCNKIASLPPELRRRFKAGTFFVDLPNAEEREAIWRLYLDRYQLPRQPRPDDTEWTGAEIKQCCALAAEDLDCSLIEASQYVVPVARSARESIEQLRSQAHDRFISASAPGFYRSGAQAAAVAVSRAIGDIPED